MAKRRKAKVRLGSSSEKHLEKLEISIELAHTHLKRARNAKSCDVALTALLSAAHAQGRADAHFTASGEGDNRAFFNLERILPATEKAIIKKCVK